MKGFYEMKDAIKPILKTVFKLIVFKALFFIFVGFGELLKSWTFRYEWKYYGTRTVADSIFLSDAFVWGYVFLISAFVAYKFKFIRFEKGNKLQNILSTIFIILFICWMYITFFMRG